MREPEKKILIYNRAQYDDKNNRGGGVSVFLKSLILKYIEHNISIDFVSSGCHYDLFSKKAYYRKTSNIYERKGVDSFEIVNSPIKAPGHDSFFEPRECLENEEVVEVFLSLLKSLEKHDEIHFHNIEGISTNLFERIREESSAKIIVWLHNYHWICPQLDLFKDNVAPCSDYLDGIACVGCLENYRDLGRKKRIHSLVSFLELNKVFQNSFGARLTKYIRITFELFRASLDSSRQLLASMRTVEKQNFTTRSRENTMALKALVERGIEYKRWRETNLTRMNLYVDCTVAVSQLVKDKFEQFGASPDNIDVVPLGMDVYDPNFIELGRAKSMKLDLPLRLGYVGYGTVAKGLPFFLDAVEKIPSELKSNFSIHIVSALTDVARRRLIRLAASFDIQLTERYSRSELQELANSIDVVVVPPVWWETYNQVAYEMLMHGVPVFISDTTGISAYINPDYVFKSGCEKSLVSLLVSTIEKPDTLVNYWQSSKFNVPGMDEHFSNLERVISGCLVSNPKPQFCNK